MKGWLSQGTRTLLILMILMAASGNAGTVDTEVAPQGPALAPADSIPHDDRAAAIAAATGELREIERRLASDPGNVEAHIQRIRLLYFLAIDDEPHLDRAEAAIADVGARLGTRVPDGGSSSDLTVTLQAYSAALRVLKGKHATWPFSKLSHVRNGLGQMDEAVERTPEHVELRYLRLVSGFYLPGIFGRRDAVDEDLRALEQLLPLTRTAFPASTFAAMATFVLEHGPSTGRAVEPLERALEQAQRDVRAQSRVSWLRDV